jgi:hypothetical protein
MPDMKEAITNPQDLNIVYKMPEITVETAK